MDAYKHLFANNFDPGKALDVLYSGINDMLCEGKFETVDHMLSVVPVKQCSIDVLIWLLTVTLVAARKLNNRDDFLKRVKKELFSRGEPDAEDLLGGLE